MKKFVLILVFSPFLLNYSNFNSVSKKENLTGNYIKINLAQVTSKLNYNSYLMPDTSSDTVIKAETNINLASQKF
jgi:hypothetical protein